MAWSVQPNRVPTSIGRIDHFLDDIDGTSGNQSLQYNLAVLDQDSNAMRMLNGDEVPHLTSVQVNNLQAFMDNRRTNIPADLAWDAGHTPGRLTWRFRDLDGTNPGRSLYLRAVELDEAGQFVQAHVVDDQPNLTAGQVTAALDFLDTQRAKAVTKILG